MPIARERMTHPHQDQGVQRVPVLAQGVVDEPVVGGVLGGGEQGAVEPDTSGLVIDLVLVPAALGDFDGDVEVHGSLLLEEGQRSCVTAPPDPGRGRWPARSGGVGAAP
jgi:hypothetical protein